SCILLHYTSSSAARRGFTWVWGKQPDQASGGARPAVAKTGREERTRLRVSSNATKHRERKIRKNADTWKWARVSSRRASCSESFSRESSGVVPVPWWCPGICSREKLKRSSASLTVGKRAIVARTTGNNRFQLRLCERIRSRRPNQSSAATL